MNMEYTFRDAFIIVNMNLMDCQDMKRVAQNSINQVEVNLMYLNITSIPKDDTPSLELINILERLGKEVVMRSFTPSAEVKIIDTSSAIPLDAFSPTC